MDGLDAGVIEAPEVDSPELDEAEELGNAEGGLEEQPEAESTEQAAVKDDPYTTKFSREMRAALKQWEQANPEAARFAKQARDNHARLFALQQVEPRGIDGIRENYALLQAIGGTEGLTGLQERIAGVEAVDQLLAAGDPKAFDELGPDFAEGLAKLAPAYLERVAQTNPEAFEAAILPHLVSKLASSPMISDFNAAVDVLKEAPPSWLTPDQKTHWAADRMQRVVAHVAKMAEWFNGLGSKAGEIKTQPVDKAKSEFEAERTKFEQEKQEAHWNTAIKPEVSRFENAKFEELFKPYQVRLKLDAGAKQDLMQSYKAALNKAGSADQEYLRQMKIYRSQKNPDPTAVTNYVKNAINKHSKTAMESLVKARYGSFLAGKPRTQQVTPGAKPQGPVSPNVEIRTVKPPMNEIDHRNTPVEWLAQKKYRLYGGKVIQVRTS
jgi:hypothetical protein